MPVIVTFDIQGAPPVERNHLQSAFERLGWETLGGTAYRYPRLGAHQPTEDWFNHVIPALMLIRSYLLKSGRPLTRFTLDAQSSTGMNQGAGYGTVPLTSGQVPMYQPGNLQFGEANLRTWLDVVTNAYPY
jgi:hypothetical protein